MLDDVLIILLLIVGYYVYNKFQLGKNLSDKMLQTTENVNRMFENRVKNRTETSLYDEELYGFELVRKLKEYINSVENYVVVDETMRKFIEAIQLEDYKFLSTTKMFDKNRDVDKMYQLIINRIFYNNIRFNNNIVINYEFEFGQYFESPVWFYNITFPKIPKYVLKSSFWHFDQQPQGIYIGQMQQMSKWDNGQFCLIAFTDIVLIQSLRLNLYYKIKIDSGNGKFFRYKDLLIVAYGAKNDSLVIVEYPYVKFLNLKISTIDLNKMKNGKLENSSIDMNLSVKSYDIFHDKFIDKSFKNISEKYNLVVENNYLKLNNKAIIYSEKFSVMRNDGNNVFRIDYCNQNVNVNLEESIY